MHSGSIYKSSNLRDVLDKKKGRRTLFEEEDDQVILDDLKSEDEKLEEIIISLDQDISFEAIGNLTKEEFEQLLLNLPEDLREKIRKYFEVNPASNLKKPNFDSQNDFTKNSNILDLLKKNLFNKLIRRSTPSGVAKLFRNCNDEFKNIIIQNLALKSSEKSNMSLILILQDGANSQYSSKISNILLGKNHYQKTVENSAHIDLYHYMSPKYKDIFLQKLYSDKSKNSSEALCKIFENRPELRVSISENLFSDEKKDLSANHISPSDMKFIYENSEAKTKTKIIELISNNIKTLDPSYLEIYKISDDIFKEKIENSLFAKEKINHSAGKIPIDIINNYAAKCPREKREEFLDSLLSASHKKFDELLKIKARGGSEEISNMLDKRADSYVKSSNEESICFALKNCNEKLKENIIDCVISSACVMLPNILSKSENLERDSAIVKNIIERRISKPKDESPERSNELLSSVAISLERKGLIKLSPESREQCRENLFSMRLSNISEKLTEKVAVKSRAHSLERSI